LGLSDSRKQEQGNKRRADIPLCNKNHREPLCKYVCAKRCSIFEKVTSATGGFRELCYEAATFTLPATTKAPERAVLEAIQRVVRGAGRRPADLSMIIHGRRLATHAIGGRKGARTALVTTEGFRDTIEIRHENRFEQYDVNIDLPPPLVPRRLRFVVPERVDARGRVVIPLDEAAVERLAPQLAGERVESVAIGFLHSFTNPEAAKLGMPEAIRYSAEADARSWAALQQLFSETLRGA